VARVCEKLDDGNASVAFPVETHRIASMKVKEQQTEYAEWFNDRLDGWGRK
jgi:hypothetical protein